MTIWTLIFIVVLSTGQEQTSTVTPYTQRDHCVAALKIFMNLAQAHNGVKVIKTAGCIVSEAES